VSVADLWMSLGAELWPLTYGAGLRTHTAMARKFETLKIARIAAFQTAGAIFATSWADVAFPKIVTTHKYAAALMCTKTDASVVEGLHVPWKAFAIAVPDGLITIGERSYDTIGVLVAPDEEVDGGVTISLDGRKGALVSKLKLSISIAGREGGLCLQIGSDNVAKGLFREASEEEFLHEVNHNLPLESEAKRRVILLARRLVVGMLVGLQTQNFVEREVVSKERTKGRRSGEPTHRTIFVRPQALSIDCRPAVKDYLTSLEGAPPLYQTLVRGHYKKQAHGLGKTMRKIIWIEPYWRGPDEAAIIVRPYTIGLE
jgi:hypothetical protein